VDGKGIPIGSLGAGARAATTRRCWFPPWRTPPRRWEVSARRGEHPLGDRAYDSLLTREHLRERGLIAQIANKGQPAALAAGQRWVSERTNSSWQAKLAHKQKPIFTRMQTGFAWW
jgi:hypothetical protein